MAGVVKSKSVGYGAVIYNFLDIDIWQVGGNVYLKFLPAARICKIYGEHLRWKGIFQKSDSVSKFRSEHIMTNLQSGQRLVKIHPTADVSSGAQIGAGTSIWNDAQVREEAIVGSDCVISKGVYIDKGVRIGSRVKIQNNVSVYQGVEIEDGVFCGPHCVFTNDKHPRAITVDGRTKSACDWKVTPTRVCRGASIGANTVIVCGITIGEWAMIGAGSVVTKDVSAHALVLGNPARQVGSVCSCGQVIPVSFTEFSCDSCKEREESNAHTDSSN